MPLGPFDRRNKRSRCTSCAASHTKKRGTLCVFSAQQSPEHAAAIVLSKGKHFTAHTFAATTVARPESPLADMTACYIYHFDMFIKRNSFAGGEPSFLTDVQSLSKVASASEKLKSSHLFSAMLALGAMQTHVLGISDNRKNLQFALSSYAQSIGSLRRAVSDTSPTSRARVLWSTFFLGLFELMQDASGQRWLQHMVFGTSQALVASGPSACVSGPNRTFFIQARTFEVCRSIIFNQPSFLATPEWMALTGSLSNASSSRHGSNLDNLLQLIVLCSALRSHTAHFIDVFSRSAEPDCFLSTALDLAMQGFEIREELEKWNSISSASPETGQEVILARTYYSATSIYLSGNYDYDLQHWQAVNVAVPILQPEQIVRHFDAIIRFTTKALKCSDLSPLLFLFPLRVAGARARQTPQRRAVMELLCDVRKQFIVADAMITELEVLWASNHTLPQVITE
ncbi:hypothetical protein CCHL11_03852 [Colletotrichum chlorophyti]|uniref:Uncharacterized protein n=1 Tax=Colletotrichum chlorophyti TaxID=708187 RepID=A0A1Q8RQR3_9PEZI|nr:hypothetical protein CCHL11_03852 [Colletotrichum chlorophyti]